MNEQVVPFDPEALELLEYCGSLGIKLFLSDDQLKFSAPKGVMDDTVVDSLRRHKTELIRILNHEANSKSMLDNPISAYVEHAHAHPQNGYPLSYAQQRFWFLDQLAGGNSPIYNMLPIALRADGPLRIEVLKEVFQDLIHRHIGLSTKFGLKDGEPRQWPGQGGEVPFTVYDLSHRDDDTARITEIILEEGERPFDLKKGSPLIRVGVLRFSDDKHILVLTLHHICADGWSLGNLVGEISAMYEAKIAGKKVGLDPLDIHYGQFAQWERAYLDQHRIQRGIHQWRKLLQGAPYFLELPTDRPRPRLQSFNGRTFPFVVDEATTAALRSTAKATNTTPYMVLLSAFAVLLSRYSRQDDLIIGSPISARPHHDLEPLVGLFLNTLPMRVDLTESPDFLQLLSRVKSMSLKAFEHGEVPFDELLQALEVGRSLNHTPLFQVLFALQNAPSGELRAGDIKLTDLEPENSKAPFDLVLSMEERGSVIHGRFRYNTDLFDEDTLRRMSGHFTVLLQRLLDQPGVPVHQVMITTDSEVEELLQLRGEGRSFDVDTTLQQMLEHAADRFSENTALRYEGQSYSYSWLRQRANAISIAMGSVGVAPQDRVGIYMQRTPDLIATIWAILKMGACYVPLDPVYPADRLSFMIDDAGLKIVVTDEASIEGLPEAGQTNLNVDSIGDSDPVDDRTGHNGSLVTGNPADVAYIIYTSGSTGLPKGVEVTHTNVIRLFSCTQAYYGFNSDDVWTLFHSYAFDFSVWEIFGALLYGGTLVLVPRETARASDAFHELLIKEKVTVLNQTPSAFTQLSEVDRRENGVNNHLRWVIFGGEALDPRSLEGWFSRHGYHQPRLVNMYGITETTVHVTWHEITEQDVRNGASVIGSPIPDLTLDLCDKYGQLVPIGIPGEIVVGGAGVANGYLNRPELNEQRFFTESLYPGMHAERHYKSGDLARRRGDGRVQYLGRIDHQVKVRGFRIELGEIESIINAFDGVSAAAVKVIPSSSGNELAGYVVFQPEVLASERLTALREHLHLKLPEYMVPSAIVTLDQMPLTHNGKTDLKALPDPGRESHATAQEIVAPRNALEEVLETLWCEVVRLPKASIHDNFFELGGDSIKAAVFSNRIQERFGCIFYVVAIFEAPTIAELAAYIAKHYPEIGAHFSDTNIQAQKQSHRIGPNDVNTFQAIVPPLRPYLPATTTKKNRKAVFVLAPPRSGTTLLRVLLGGHPQLFAPPELELMPFNTLQERAATYAGRDSFWLEGTMRALMEAQQIDAAEAKAAMESLEKADLSVKDFYHELQSMVGDQLLVDKSPSYVLHPSILDRIEDTFEDAMYIHLHRHPLGMVHSFEEAKLDQIFFRHPHTFSTRELAELIWLQSHTNIASFLQTIPNERHTRISFEDMTRNPAGEMERICSFLGIPFDPQMLSIHNEQEKKRRMTDGLFAESRMLGDVKFHTHDKIDATTSERWRSAYSEEQLGDPTIAIARDLGYDIATYVQPSAPTAETKERPKGSDSGLHSTTDPSTKMDPSGSNTELRPLSQAQKRLWFFDQLEPGKATYNMPVALRLHGNVNIQAMTNAIEQLQLRHEVLRTTIQTRYGDPIARVSPYAAPMSIIDLTSFDLDTRNALSETWIHALSNEPFNLLLGPLFRSALLKLDAGEYMLVLCMHHIVSDGWSLGVISEELAELYRAFVTDADADLPALNLQYSDYAQWQEELANSGEMQRQTEYWRMKLSDLPALLDLPTDKPRPTVKTYEGATYRFELGSDLTSKMRKLAEGSNATPFMVLMAIYGLVLQKYSGQRDIPVGTPFANRKKAAFEPLVGFFVNTQVLRLNIGKELTFAQLIAQIRATALEAYSHQDVSFEYLVEALQPERNMGYSPLFQVMMTMQTHRMEVPSMPGIMTEIVEHQNTISKYDLTLLFAEEGDQLSGYLEYSTDLFEEWRIRQMAAHFTHILSQVSLDDEHSIDQLPLMSPSSALSMLANWNDTYRPIDFSNSVIDMIDRQAELDPDKIAVYAKDRNLTYAQLKVESDHIAAHIQALGLKHGSMVVVALEREAHLITALLATWKAGHAYIPIDPAYPPQRIEMIFEDAEVALLITRKDIAHRFPDTSKQLLIDTIDFDTPFSTKYAPKAVAPTDLAYVIFTSGSTGRPKGVMVPHGAMQNFILSTHHELGISHKDTTYALTTISFDIAVMEIWGSLAAGASIDLADESVVKDPAAIIKRISKGDITLLQATPATWSMMLEYGWHSSHNTTFVTGGEPLSPNLAHALLKRGSALWNMYGPTETTVYSTATLVEASMSDRFAFVSIGKPIANTSIYILNDHLQPMPPGMPGTLYIGGLGIASGYLNREDLTSERFVSDPFAADIAHINGSPQFSLHEPPTMYNSGDLARFHPDGVLEFLGRIDHQVKLRGFRIELGEIEFHLNNHPDVSVSAVVLHGTGLDAKLVAYIIPKPNVVLETASLAAHLKPLVPDYMVPTHFVQVEAYPLTPNGKLDRQALSKRAIEMDTERSIGLVQARDVFELRMSKIWSSLLEMGNIGPEDHFFEIGGHSLVAVRLMAMVNAEFGLHVPLAVLFQNPTLESFTQWVRNSSGTSIAWPTLIPLRAGTNDSKALILIPGAGGNILYMQALAASMVTDAPIFGLQPPGLDGVSQPCETVEQLAAHYLEALALMVPGRSLTIAGHSFGGLVAYEIARQIENNAAKISWSPNHNILILDAPAPHWFEPTGREWSMDRWVRQIADIAAHQYQKKLDLTDLENVTSGQNPIHVLHQALINAGIFPPETPLRQLEGFINVYRSNLQMEYRPSGKLNSGNISLIRSVDLQPEHLNDPRVNEVRSNTDLGWSTWVGGDLNIITTPGDHLTMLNPPNVSSLADIISRMIGDL